MSSKRTLDPSDSPFSSSKSPRRSILRTTESPFRFNSPLYSQDPGSGRRVSFAPDANFRVFDQTASPNAYKRFETDITTELHFTDNIPFLLDEDEPSMLLNTAIDSPSSSFFRKPSASPSDFRIRRSDLFGSPRSSIKRSGGAPPTLLKRVQNENDLTDLLPSLPGRAKRNIFEDDDDDDEVEETLDNSLNYESEQEEMQITQPNKPQEINQRQELVTKDIYSDEEESMKITQNTLVDQYSDDDNMNITQPSPIRRTPTRNYSNNDDMDITQPSPTRRTPIRDYSDNDDMDITQPSPIRRTSIKDHSDNESINMNQTSSIKRYTDEERRRSIQTTPIRDYLDNESRDTNQNTFPRRFSDDENMRTTQTNNHDSDDDNMRLTQPNPIQPYSDEESMQITQPNPIPPYSDEDSMQITQPNPIPPYSDEDSMQITQSTHKEPYLEEESMQITQTKPVKDYSFEDDMDLTQEQFLNTESMNITQTHKSPVRTPLRSPLSSSYRSPQPSPYRSTQTSPYRSPYRSVQASPVRSLQASPIRSPFRSSLRASLGTPPRASTTSFKSPSKPLSKTPSRTPLKSPVRTSIQGSLRSPLGTPQRAAPSSTSRYLNSPIRSTSHRTLSAVSPRSFYIHDNQSVASTYREEVSNILQESPSYFNSNSEVILNEPKLTLSDFLRDAGVTFPKDRPTNDTVLDSDYDYDLSVNETDEISSSILPEIRLYQKACEQLIDSIRKSDEIIENIEQDINAANPQLFTEFKEGSAATQLRIQEQLQAIKRYSLIRSRQEWLTIWTNCIREFPETLMDLQNKLNLYYEFEKSIGEKLLELNEYYKELMVIVNHYRQKKYDYNMIDHEQLDRLSIEIENQNILYQELKKNTDELEMREKELKDQDEALEAEILRLNKELKDAEKTIEQIQCITRRDLAEVKKEYDDLSDMFGWDIKEMDDDIFHLQIDKGVEIIVDKKKLQKHAPDAVYCQLSDEKENDLGPFITLLQGFKVVGKDQWDMNEIVQDIAIYWNRIRLIIRSIELVQRRTWVEIKALENDKNPKEAGFSLEICLFSFEGKSKTNIKFLYKVKDIMKFPELDFSTLTVEVCYGKLPHDELKELIIQELSKDGILNMIEALHIVMEQTLVST